MVGLPEDTELSESPSFSFLNVGMSVLRAFLAPLAASLVQPVIYSLVKVITER